RRVIEMIGRKALAGLSLLCALAFTAFSAASASAATSGTTAFTCVDTSTENPANVGDYTDAHCDTTGTEHSSRYAHRALAANPTEHVVSTNAGTANNTMESTKSILEATVGGIVTKLEGATVSSSGTLENVLEGEEHKIKGSGITITYTGVTVANPANCKVHSP